MSEVLDSYYATSQKTKRIPGQNIWSMTSLAQPRLDSGFLLVIHSNDSSHVSHDLRSNIQKLEGFKNLGFDWNGNKAEPFSEDLIEKAKSVLFTLNVQPEVFPTARKSIQFEYEKENGDYLEFEIFEDSAKFLQVINEIESSNKIDCSNIFYKVNEFYGEGFYQR
ncbi:hypothetical protein [Algoriphagus algorifonticola]|uniref:hypothetical protein n=1 Tax=Algoriphagus algorifonticola TaxID=2593007 RepID=UPI0011A00F77|nr:hypothetical protein [Algoriphagus algorifonticola]